MLTRTRHNVTLHVHCLHCWSSNIHFVNWSKFTTIGPLTLCYTTTYITYPVYFLCLSQLSRPAAALNRKNFLNSLKNGRHIKILVLDNDQLDTRLLYFTIRLLLSSTCFEHYMLIVRRVNCIDAASGIVTLSKWLSGAQVERELSTCAPDGHLLRISIPDTATIQFILLKMSI